MRYVAFIQSVAREWREDRGPQRSASLAYYGLISIVPLALLALTLIPIFTGGGLLEGQILTFTSNIFGLDSLPFFERIFSNVRTLRGDIIYSLIGLFVLLYGTSKLFANLKRDLEEICGDSSELEGSSLTRAVKERGRGLAFLAFLFVLAVVFLAVNVAMSIVIGALGESLPLPSGVLYILNTFVTLLIVGGLYTVVYRVGSGKHVSWKNSFSGGMVASLAFLLLNGLFSLYLHSSVFLSVFGSATFVIALLLWIYYGAQILLIGAEVAKVFSRNET